MLEYGNMPRKFAPTRQEEIAKTILDGAIIHADDEHIYTARGSRLSIYTWSAVINGIRAPPAAEFKLPACPQFIIRHTESELAFATFDSVHAISSAGHKQSPRIEGSPICDAIYHSVYDTYLISTSQYKLREFTADCVALYEYLFVCAPHGGVVIPSHTSAHMYVSSAEDRPELTLAIIECNGADDTRMLPIPEIMTDTLLPIAYRPNSAETITVEQEDNLYAIDMYHTSGPLATRICNIGGCSNRRLNYFDHNIGISCQFDKIVAVDLRFGRIRQIHIGQTDGIWCASTSGGQYTMLINIGGKHTLYI